MTSVDLDLIMASLDNSKNIFIRSCRYSKKVDKINLIDYLKSKEGKVPRIAVEITDKCPGKLYLGADFYIISKFSSYNVTVKVLSKFLENEFSDIFRPVYKFR